MLERMSCLGNKWLLPRKIWGCAIDRGYDVIFGCHGIVMSTDTNSGCGILTTNIGSGCDRALVPKNTRSSDHVYESDGQSGCGDVYVYNRCSGYGYGYKHAKMRALGSSDARLHSRP